MSKKLIIVLVLLSFLVTYGFAVIDAILTNSLIGGEAGIPLKFIKGAFGSSSTDYMNFIIDFIFWFVILFGVKVLARKLLKKANN